MLSKLGYYSELSSKHAANLILFEKVFPPTRLLEPTCLLILGEISNYKIIFSSFKLLFCGFKHFKVASKS